MEPNLANWTTLDVLLAAGAALATAALFARGVADLLGKSFLRFTPLDHPDAARPVDADAVFHEYYASLTADGFEPVGVILEEAGLVAWAADFRTAVHVLRSHDGKTYACLYKFDFWRLALQSVTADGSLVRTVTPGVGMRDETARFSLFEAGPCEPEDLVDFHDDHVERFLRARGGAVAVASLAELVDADVRESRRQLRKQAWGWLFLRAGSLALLSVNVTYLLGLLSDLSAPTRVAVAVLASSCFLLAPSLGAVIARRARSRATRGRAPDEPM